MGAVFCWAFGGAMGCGMMLSNYIWRIGWVRYRNSRKIVGTPKNVTLSRKGKQWYVSIQVEYETPEMRHKSTSAMGIDMGVKRFATLSDGSFIEPLNSFKKSAKKLATLQRKLKHKKKFSKNWQKQKAKITKHHEHTSEWAILPIFGRRAGCAVGCGRLFKSNLC